MPEENVYDPENPKVDQEQLDILLRCSASKDISEWNKYRQDNRDILTELCRIMQKRRKRRVLTMSSIAERTMDVFERLDETSQVSVLKFAEFLAAENDNDVALYDEAKANDDGYRISANDLRAKYGI
jgi:hypothetical protein